MSPSKVLSSGRLLNLYGPARKFTEDKHSSLFSPSISDEDEKAFIILAAGVNVIKLFFFITDDKV